MEYSLHVFARWYALLMNIFPGFATHHLTISSA
jgi:hypothetical protein